MIFPIDSTLKHTIMIRHIAKLRHLHCRFSETGRIDQGNEHRGRTSVEPQIVEAIGNIYKENPSTSIRQVAQQVPVCKTSVHKVVRKNLKLYPYKIQMLQSLEHPDYEKRESFARTVLDLINTDATFLQRVCCWWGNIPCFWQCQPAQRQSMGTWEPTCRNWIWKSFSKTERLVWHSTRQGDWDVLLRRTNDNTDQFPASSTGVRLPAAQRQTAWCCIPAGWCTTSLGASCQGVFGWGISKSLDWSWRTHLMASSISWCDTPRCFSLGLSKNNSLQVYS